MNLQQLDPVNVAIVVAGVLFGPALAGIIGPYAVIILCATVGAGWSLGRRRMRGLRLGAAWYFLRLNATAVVVTVGLATLAGRWLSIADPSWLLSPIALLVGGVGDDWPKLIRWLMARAGRLIERRTGGEGNP